MVLLLNFGWFTFPEKLTLLISMVFYFYPSPYFILVGRRLISTTDELRELWIKRGFSFFISRNEHGHRTGNYTRLSQMCPLLYPSQQWVDGWITISPRSEAQWRRYKRLGQLLLSNGIPQRPFKVSLKSFFLALLVRLHRGSTFAEHEESSQPSKAVHYSIWKSISPDVIGSNFNLRLLSKSIEVKLGWIDLWFVFTRVFVVSTQQKGVKWNLSTGCYHRNSGFATP